MANGKTNWRYIAGVATGFFVVSLVTGLVSTFAMKAFMPNVYHPTVHAIKRGFAGSDYQSMKVTSKGVFHPQVAASWPEFIVGTVLAGIFLGVGWSLGSIVVNHLVKKHHHHKHGSSAAQPY